MIEVDPFLYRDMIENEMYNRKQKIIKKLSTIVHPKYANPFASILHTAFVECDVMAKLIADELDLGTIDFVALSEDIEEFEVLFIKEKELEYAGNF